MNIKLLITLFFILISLESFSQDIILKNANIIPMNSDTVLMNQSIWIHNGKINQIADFKSLPKKVRKNKRTNIIDATSRFILPGLADMHVHFPDSTKIPQMLLSNVAAGVTHIRIMNSEEPQNELKQYIGKNNFIQPQIHYSHLINDNEFFSPFQADSLMMKIKNDQSIAFVKLYSLSDETSFLNLAEAAKKHSVIFCGHFPYYKLDGTNKMLTLEQTILSGFKSIEHLGGYSWINDQEKINEAILLTNEFNVYNCPTMDWDLIATNYLNLDELKSRLTYQLIPKTLSQEWESQFQAEIQKNGGVDKVLEQKKQFNSMIENKHTLLQSLYKNNCSLLIGSDPGAPFQAHGFNVYEEMILWGQLGIDNYTILKSATLNASMFFNEADEWGTIEVGKNADFIMLEQNPLIDIKNISSLQMTMVNGKIYSKKDLFSLLEKKKN